MIVSNSKFQERERSLATKWSFNLKFHIQIKQSIKHETLEQTKYQDYNWNWKREREGLPLIVEIKNQIAMEKKIFP